MLENLIISVEIVNLSSAEVSQGPLIAYDVLHCTTIFRCINESNVDKSLKKQNLHFSQWLTINSVSLTSIIYFIQPISIRHWPFVRLDLICNANLMHIE